MRLLLPKTVFLALSFVLGGFAALGHPGIGVVMDKRGNVFYSDLAQVWRISPDGQKKVVVPNVHTHELGMDDQGNLYGEDSHYSGEATNKWDHSYWKLSAAGKLSYVYRR